MYGDVVAAKYDIYCIGCILFYLCTGEYMTQSLTVQFKEYHDIINKYGSGVANLIEILTNRNPIFRCDISIALRHPCF